MGAAVVLDAADSDDVAVEVFLAARRTEAIMLEVSASEDVS